MNNPNNNKMNFNKTAGSAFFASNSFHFNSNSNTNITSTTVGSMLGNTDNYSSTTSNYANADSHAKNT